MHKHLIEGPLNDADGCTWVDENCNSGSPVEPDEYKARRLAEKKFLGLFTDQSCTSTLFDPRAWAAMAFHTASTSLSGSTSLGHGKSVVPLL